MQMSAKKLNPAAVGSPTQQLCAFLSSIRYEDLPAPVVARTEELFLDWFASALAGKGARPVSVIDGFAAAMGPKACSCTDPARFPVSAAAVARVRKQVGQGMPVSARSGHGIPGSRGCCPLNQR